MELIDTSVHILLLSKDEASCAVVRDSLAQLGNPTLTEIADLAALKTGGAAGRCDLVVACVAPGEKKSLRLYERITRRWPDTPLVVVAEDVEPDAVAAALARGVREVVPRSGDVAARLALHLETQRLRHKLRPGEAGVTRSAAFFQALGETVQAMQAAPSCQAAFDALSGMLKAFDLETLILEYHADRTYTIEHISLQSDMLRAFQQVSGIDVHTYVGRTGRVAFVREVLSERRAVYVDDLTPVIVEWLGFRGAKPIASRTRAVLGVSEMIAAPLITDGEIGGLLLVVGSGKLTPDDIPFVNVLAAGWQGAWAQESRGDRADQLRLVAQIGREAATFPDMESLLYRVLRHLQAAVPVDYATIALVEGDYAVCRIETSKGETYQPPSERGVGRLRVGKEGIIGRVAAEGETLLANDVRLEPRYLADPDRPDVRSELAVPLRYREEIVGVLDVESSTLAAYSQSHVDLLEAVAAQLATIIATTRLRAEVSRLAQEVEALTGVGEALSSVLPLEERLSRIVQQARRAIGAEGGALHLLDGDGAALVEAVTLDVPGFSEVIARLAERVALGGQGEGLSSAEESAGDRRLLSVRLRAGSRSLGAITLTRPGDQPFAEEDRWRLSAFANLAAVAVSFERLVEQNERQRQLAETLNVVSRVVGSSLELNKVMDAILSALQEVIAYASASIMLFEGGKLAIANSRSMSDRELLAHRDVDWTKLPTVRHLIAQRRPLVISNTEQDEMWRDIPATEYIKSWIGIPLISRGNMIGILNVNSVQRGHYQAADGNHVMAFANQIATALDNALLLHQAEERQLEARALYEATRVMVSSADVDERIGQVLAGLRQVIPYEVGALLRVWEQNSEQPYHIKMYAPQPVEEDLIALARQYIIEGYRVLSSNLVSRRAVQRDLHSAIAVAEEDRLPSRLSVPLLLGDRLLGMVELSSTAPGAYDESDLRILSTVASPLATALENASLLDDLRARAHELEEADRLKDEVVQNISHELRNPLTFIRGYVQLLLDGDLGPLSEEQTHSLGVVSVKTDALVRLVNDIITLNSVTPETLQREPKDIGALVEEAVRGVEASASAQGLSVRAELPDSPQVALVDPYRLNQVIDNLLSNALKFSDEGASVIARVTDLGTWVGIEVEDEGVGIPLEMQSRIFDRFIQGDSSPTRKYQGVGLGLAISKQIVEAHGGRIGVRSEPEQGSTFYVELVKYEGD